MTVRVALITSIATSLCIAFAPCTVVSAQQAGSSTDAGLARLEAQFTELAKGTDGKVGIAVVRGGDAVVMRLMHECQN